MLLIEQQQYLMAFCTIIVAYGLDFFDGYVARKLKQVTEFGAKLDPTADKGLNILILNFSPITEIFNYQIFGITTIGLITIIEILLFTIAWVIKPVMSAYGFSRKLGANWFGKTKMFFESAAVITGILFLTHWLDPFQDPLMWLANAFLLLAIIFGICSIIGHLYFKNNKAKR